VEFAAVHKIAGYLVEPQNQDRRLGGRRRDLGTEKLRCRRTCGGIAGLASGGRSLRQRRDCVMKRSAT
jgi:hypothetical protein